LSIIYYQDYVGALHWQALFEESEVRH